MARFFAAIQGARGEATRFGGKGSGIHAQAQGWNSGVKVVGHVNVKDEDEFTIYATTGSGGSVQQIEIACIVDGRIILNEAVDGDSV